MDRLFRRIALLISLLIASSPAADAAVEKRVALVIGNSSYQHTTVLRNPQNDAADIVGALKRLGFDVIDGIDLDKRSMERAIRQFGVRLSGADVALFFYAGHGLQLFGQNYLLPVDARLSTESDVDFESIALHLVLKQMEREAKTNLIFLDACRDNPLARNLARNMGTRSTQVGQGLAEVRTGIGTLIAFSTQPGNVALDGTGRNSPYTAALLRQIEHPGRDIGATLISVRNEVVGVTTGRQVPWEHTSLMGQVVLSPATAAAPSLTASHAQEAEMAFWNAVKESDQTIVLQSYLDRYPRGIFASTARELIERTTRGEAKDEGEESRKLASKIQRELKRVGCDPGEIDGQWSKQSQSALQRFATTTRLALYVDRPSQTALDAVSHHKMRVCPEVEGGRAPVKPRAVNPASGGARAACRSGDVAACQRFCSAGDDRACYGVKCMRGDRSACTYLKATR